MGPGGLPGLQNRVWGGDPVLGGFDSYTLPPKKVPSIDKKILVSRWFVICPKVLFLRHFRAFCFCLAQYFAGLFRRILDLNRPWSQIILTICPEIVKIEPMIGVSFNDTRKGVCIETLPPEDLVKAKKNGPLEGEPCIHKCYAITSEPFLNRNVIALS